MRKVEHEVLDSHFMNHPTMVDHSVTHFSTIFATFHGTLNFFWFTAFMNDVSLQSSKQFVTFITSYAFIIVFVMFEVSSNWWWLSTTKISNMSSNWGGHFESSIACGTWVFVNMKIWKKIKVKKKIVSLRYLLRFETELHTERPKFSFLIIRVFKFILKMNF